MVSFERFCQHVFCETQTTGAVVKHTYTHAPSGLYVERYMGTDRVAAHKELYRLHLAALEDGVEHLDSVPPEAYAPSTMHATSSQGADGMKFLNGWKTILGVIGTVGTVLVASGGSIGHAADVVVQASHHLDAVFLGVFGLLGTLGVVHKVEKAK